MNSARFQILCLDGVWRWVFCRAMNGANDPRTASAIVTTDRKQSAFVAWGETAIADSLAYFAQHSHGRTVRTATGTEGAQ